MLHFRLVPVLWFSVITSCMIVEKYVYTATRNAAVSPIEVCFWVKRGGSRSCTTFENLTALNEFMSTPYVKVEIHDQVLTKVHKYSFSPVMYTKELVIWNCGVVEIEAGAFNNSLSLLKFDVQKNKLEIVRTGVFNGLLITHLNLAHNKIRTIEPEALSYMQNLEEVILLNNLISAYDAEWFNKTPLLRSLYFQNNTIKEIPDTAFKNLIDKPFGLNLFFSFNQIRLVHPMTFQSLTNNTMVQKLYLDHNLLETWSEALSMNVNELKISFNHIKCIQGDLHKTIKNNSLCNFIQNPYECGCLKEIKTIGDQRAESSKWFSAEYLKCRRRKSSTKYYNVSDLIIFSSPMKT